MILKYKYNLIIYCLFLGSFYACKKNDALAPGPVKRLPKIITLEISSITASTAITGGNVTDTGSTTIIARGVCYSSRDTLPDLNNLKTVHNSGPNNFKDTLTNLTRNTTYYVRAYATNTAGTTYGEAKKFTTSTLSSPMLFTTVADPKTITETQAILGGNILNNGGTMIIEKGVCYSSTNNNPTIITDRKITVAGTELGNFSIKVTGLTPGTDYYVRAYAINSTDTAYGQEYSFHTRTIPSTVTDGDGNIYHPILIGSQVWLQENLKTTTYNDGTPIPLVGYDNEWKNLSTPAYCWYENNTSNKDIYGALYNGYVVDPANSKNVCPIGFHVPTDYEFTTLNTAVNNDGGALKETGTRESVTGHWKTPNEGAINSSGFTALPGGFRDSANGYFYHLGAATYFWTSSSWNNDNIINWSLVYNSSELFARGGNKSEGNSVRCVRD